KDNPARVLSHNDDTPVLQIIAFARNIEWAKENGWISECYGEKREASVLSISVLAKGSEELVVFLLPDAGAVVREIEAQNGRAFEVEIAGRRDLLKIDGTNRPQIHTDHYVRN